MLTVAPNNAGFINRVLIFNLSDKYITELPFEEFEYDILFYTSIDIGFGINLENKNTYVFEKTDYYGPYSNPIDAITKHCFGKIDGLFFLLNNIKFNKEKSIYEFIFKDFTYSPLDYSVSNLKATTILIKETLKTIQNPFDFTLNPETDFKENTTTNFLIRLNNFFNINNFNPFTQETTFGYTARINRNKTNVLGEKIVINTNNNKHFMVYIPKLIDPNNKEIINLSSDEKVIDKIFTNNKTEITNIKDVVAAKELFGIDVKEIKVTMNEVDILKYLIAVVPTNIGERVTFVLFIEGNYYILTFNTQMKTYVLQDFNSFKSFEYDVFIYEDEDNKNKALCISNCNFKTKLNNSTNLIINNLNNVFKIDYTNNTYEFNNTKGDINYLPNIFV